MQHGDVGAADGASGGLRELILGQTARGLGVPVLLRTSAPGKEEPEPFGTEAYRVQVRLAARLLECGTTDLGPVRPADDVLPLAAALLQRPLLALNFHWIHPDHHDVVRRQLSAAAALGPTFDLAATHPVGEVRVLVAFYDGFADTAAFAADLCHRLGLRALFFPITSAAHGARLLTDAELHDLARAHEVGWHTASHASAAEVDEAAVREEVVDPFRWIERVTGRAPRVGAWRGGTRYDGALPGNRALRDLGLTHLVSNWSVEPV